MGCLPNVNPFSEENIDNNTEIAVLRTEYSRPEKKLNQQLCKVSNNGIPTRTKITAAQDSGQYCLDVPQLHDIIRVSVASSVNPLHYDTCLILCMSSKINT